MAEAQQEIPGYQEFIEMLESELPGRLEGGTIRHDGLNDLLVEDKGHTAAFSLDKAYRFYVDELVRHPDLGSDERIDRLTAFLGTWRQRLDRPAIFDVSVIDRGSTKILEQCCIR
jgi:hypothetical protein